MELAIFNQPSVSLAKDRQIQHASSGRGKEGCTRTAMEPVASGKWGCQWLSLAVAWMERDQFYGSACATRGYTPIGQAGYLIFVVVGTGKTWWGILTWSGGVVDVRPTLGGECGVGVGIKVATVESTLGCGRGCYPTRGSFGGSLCGDHSLHSAKILWMS